MKAIYSICILYLTFFQQITAHTKAIIDLETGAALMVTMMSGFFFKRTL